MVNRVRNIIKLALLPLLIAVYPTLFHYANNVVITLLSSLWRMLVFNFLVAVIIYIIFLIFYSSSPIRASIAAFVFLTFFNSYGIIYSYLLKLDLIQIEHYSLLPVFILTSIYASWLIAKSNDVSLTRFWTTATLIAGVLVILNVFRIIPHELAKAQHTTLPVHTSVINSPSGQMYPDIYYIVLDEFSGLEPMREYWHYQGVNEFKQFLEKKGFFVAEQSHGMSIVTLYELATRLNYQDYPCCNELRTYFGAIANNRVMRYLKTKGYTTVTFDESESVFPTDLPMQADYSYASAPPSTGSSGLLDDFGILVVNNTMLRAFSNIYEPLITVPAVKAHIDMLFFTLDKTKNLNEASSPKFVYIHLLLPHMPFIFDKNGTVITTTYNTNWNDYLGNYIFSLNYTEKMINNILSRADPRRPPIIILQSDHGARNQIYYGNEETLLQNFPEKFKTSILFTLYIPGYDTSSLPQNIKPINTFPIVFNYLFKTDIPLRK